MKILFICNQNKHRSKTAEEYFRKQFQTHSAGLYNTQPLTEQQLQWADIVMVMEEHQRNEIAKRFPTLYLKKKILSLNIPDVYSYNQPELIHQLELKMKTVKKLF